jgi:hypothetical protein
MLVLELMKNKDNVIFGTFRKSLDNWSFQNAFLLLPNFLYLFNKNSLGILFYTENTEIEEQYIFILNKL